MKTNITLRQVDYLCSLYLEGKLSRKEEKALYYILENAVNLTEENNLVLNLMKAEKKVFSSQKNRKALAWRYSSIAASVLILTSLALPLFNGVNTKEKGECFVVWQDGKKITGEEAKKIAEESQKADMEMIRRIMKQQRELLKRNFAVVNMEDFDL